jgi:hypothetical protein
MYHQTIDRLNQRRMIAAAAIRNQPSAIKQIATAQQLNSNN